MAVFWGQKFIQEKQAILGNNFKYKKVSCIISFTNCAYIAITNIAYKKNRTILVQGYEQILVRRYRHSFGQKLTQVKQAIFTRNLNYTNFSCIIFCVKMSSYYHYANCFQEESTYFGRRISTHFGLKVSEESGFNIIQ